MGVVRNIIENIKSRGLKDILNPKKWRDFLTSKAQKVTGVTIPHEEVLSYSEQLVYRSIICSECFKLGACIDCKCPQPDSAIVKTHECSLGRYRQMLSSEKWEKFKLDNNIKFSLSYE